MVLVKSASAIFDRNLDIDTFKALLRHYKEQGFCITVDDVGSGYSGINRIFDLNPQFIKIDMEMIRDIDKDEMKRSFVSALSQFAKDSGISLIAEGIKTSAQLETVISLKIDYAQGLYLAKPSEKFQKLNLEIKKEILRLNNTLFYVQIYFIDCIVLTILLRKHSGL